ANTAGRPVERTVSVVGTLAATAQAEVASEIEGRLVAIEADLGDRVHPEQVLARVREDDIRAKLREAEASLEKAVADEGRGRPLRATASSRPRNTSRCGRRSRWRGRGATSSASSSSAPPSVRRSKAPSPPACSTPAPT